MEKIHKCPNCLIRIELEKINCGILRCGIYQLKNKKWKQLPKHGSESRIKEIFMNHQTIGCGKSLKYDKKQNRLIIKK